MPLSLWERGSYGNMTRMNKIWNAAEYDLSRRRLIPCYDLFYATAAELTGRTVQKFSAPAILDLGAGTGLLSEFVMQKVKSASLYLLDESTDMTAKAQLRLAQYNPTIFIQSMTEPLPEISFGCVSFELKVKRLSGKVSLEKPLQEKPHDFQLTKDYTGYTHRI